MARDRIQTLRDMEVCLAGQPRLRARFSALLQSENSMDDLLAHEITAELARRAMRSHQIVEGVGRAASMVLLEWIEMQQRRTDGSQR